MTVFDLANANQIAEFNASRDVQADSANAERLARWQARYPHDVVPVPAPVQPPGWPKTCRVPNGPFILARPSANVTTLKAKAAAR